MSLVVPPNFQHILRVLNTNIDGKTSVMFALTSIKGIGRRYANLCLKKADIPLSRRAGELNEEEVEKLVTIMQVGVSMTVLVLWWIKIKLSNKCAEIVIFLFLEPSPVQDPRLVPEQAA